MRGEEEAIRVLHAQTPMLPKVHGPFVNGVLLGEGSFSDEERKQVTLRIIDATLKSVPVSLVRQKRAGNPGAAAELKRRMRSALAWRAAAWRPSKSGWTRQRGFKPPETEKGTERKLQELDFPSSDNPIEVRMEMLEDFDAEMKVTLGAQEHRLVMIDEEKVALEPTDQLRSEWLPPFFDGKESRIGGKYKINKVENEVRKQMHLQIEKEL